MNDIQNEVHSDKFNENEQRQKFNNNSKHKLGWTLMNNKLFV